MIDPKSMRLVEIIQELSLSQTLEQIVDIVRKGARELADADGATFVLREGDLCHYVDEDALGPLFKGKLFPKNICISGAAMIERSTIIIPDIYDDPRIPIDVYRPTFVRSLCMTPIRTQEPIGAIGTYWQNSHEVHKDQATLLSVLANATSIAIENVSLQNQLKARVEQIQRLTQLKDEFLRKLSHELRTPLNQILGWVEILAEGSTDPELEEGLKAMEASGHRLEAIIKDLLDCSALVAGEMPFKTSQFELGELIDPVLESFRIALDNKKIGIRKENLSSGTIVNADRDRCRDIVWQLVSNAVKFSPKGSEIFIECSRDDENSRITVIDQGIGIDKEYLPKVFELFSQADSSIARTYPGTGLGLSLSRFLAEAQGGQLEIQSTGIGFGTTATLALPTAAIRFERKKNHDPLYMANVFKHLIGNGTITYSTGIGQASAQRRDED